MIQVSMTVNGKAVSADVDPRTLLVQFLREQLRLTGTHVGCDTSQCGACVVHVDGRAIKSCTTLAASCQGAHVTTIEGLAHGGKLHPMQQAFQDNHGLQCGFCTPGMIMSAVDMVNRKGAESRRGDDPRGARRQHLPLHRLSQHRQGGDAGRPRNGRAEPAQGRRITTRQSRPARSRTEEFVGRGSIRKRFDIKRHQGGYMSATGIGASVKRKEDIRFITGKGHYVDDINRPGQAYAYFLRSPHAHATIDKIDASAALKARRASSRCFTGDDIAADKVGGLHLRLDDPFEGRLADEGGRASRAGARQGALCRRPRRRRHRRHLCAGARRGREDRRRLRRAAGRRRHRDRRQSRPAAGARRRAQQHRLQLAYRRQGRDRRGLRHRGACHQARSRQQPPDPQRDGAARGASANTIRAPDTITLYTTSQNPHVARLVLSAFIGIAPEHKLRVIAPDVGGGFGSKIFIYAEETVCAWAAKKIDRPVKWTADRTEAFLSDAHGRDHVTHAELALDAERQDHRPARPHASPISAPISRPSPRRCRPISTRLLLSGQYDIPNIYAEVDAVYTNTAPVDAYRGAGRPEATFVVERIVEIAARETGRDPAEFRRANFITSFPHQTPVILAYDAGNYARRARQGAGARRLQGRSPRARRPRRPRASCAASASPPTSKPAASRRRRRSARSAPASACGNRRRCASIRSAPSRS